MKKILSVLCIIFVLSSCLISLVSCGTPDEDPAVAEAALRENGYTVVDGASSASRFGFTGLVKSIHAYKDFESITIFYFENEDSASVAFSAMKKTINDEKEEYKKEGIEYPELELEMDYSGCVVWIGTPDAIGDAE